MAENYQKKNRWFSWGILMFSEGGSSGSGSGSRVTGSRQSADGTIQNQPRVLVNYK